MRALDDVVLLELLRDHVEEIRGAIGAGWPAFIRALQPMLRQLSMTASAETSAAIVDDALDRFLKSPAAAVVQRLLLQSRKQPELRAIRSGGAAAMRATFAEAPERARASTAASVAEWLLASDDQRFRRVPVFFATDRQPSGSTHPNKWFGGTPGQLTFGQVQVSIPEHHETGAIERPLRFFPESPERHVTLLQLRRRDEAGFLDDLGEMLAARPSPKVLVFVHGYRVPFAEAARVAAQIAFDIAFDGIPVLYSWPSEGRFLGYVKDENAAHLTREHFIKTLDVLATLRVGSAGATPQQHLLAHSMGNRVLFQGLQFVDGLHYGQVIMAAPDEDARTLESQMPRFLGRAQRTTLYASTRDWALAVSAWLHGHGRGGQGGSTGVDTIDASSIDFSLLGHSYFHQHRELLIDIKQLLERGDPPPRGLMRLAPDGRTWIFQP
jgi:esterase/lipase superfamily enzyme